MHHPTTRDVMRSLRPDLYRLRDEKLPGASPLEDALVEPYRPVSGERFAGVSYASLNFNVTYRWVVENNLTGQAYNPTTQQSQVSTGYSIGTASANNTSGGADEAFSYQQLILAGQSATVDLSAMTNLMSQSAVSIARVKSCMVRLLSLTNDSTINSNTNTNTRVCITNMGLTCPAPLYWGSGGSGLTLDITNAAGGAINTVAINVKGSGYLPNTTFMVGVNQINGASAAISVNTNAAGIPTAAVISNGGTGYIAANNVPTTELGSFWLQTGNAQMTVDVTAAGTAISSTKKNIQICNQDTVNPATFELDVAGATT